MEIIFGGGEFSSTLTPDSERAFRPLPTFQFPNEVVVGGIILRKPSEGSDFATRDAQPAKITIEAN